MSFVFQVWFQNSRARAKKCHLYSRYGSRTAEPGLKVSFVFQVWFQNSRARGKSWRGVEYQGGRGQPRELSQRELTNEMEEGQV